MSFENEVCKETTSLRGCPPSPERKTLVRSSHVASAFLVLTSNNNNNNNNSNDNNNNNNNNKAYGNQRNETSCGLSDRPGL